MQDSDRPCTLMFMRKPNSLSLRHKQTQRRELKAVRKCISMHKTMNPSPKFKSFLYFCKHLKNTIK